VARLVRDRGGGRLRGATGYRYPVYARKRGWFEQFVFWAPRIVEAPAPPVGLEGQARRRTYEGADEDPYGLEELRNRSGDGAQPARGDDEASGR